MTGPLPSASVPPTLSESEIRARDGLRLFLRRWEPGPPARAVAVVCHGGFEHGGRYGGVAAALAGEGFRTYAGDLRGCGRSAGLMGHVDSFDDYLGDLASFVARALEEAAGLPVFLVGHSMGGLLALMHLQGQADPRIRAGVISGPLLRLAFEPPGWKTAVGKVLSGVLPRLRLAHGLAAEHLSRDPDVVRAYGDDPLVFDRCSTRWYTAMVEAMARANAGPAPRIPTLWLHGEDDRINHIEGTRAFLTRPDALGARLVAYPGMYHEVFNEVGRERVLADVIEFLRSQLGADPR